MIDPKRSVEDFFKVYTDRFNRALQEEKVDTDAIVNSFSDHFIEASPSGVHAGANNAMFREAIPKGIGFYKSIGIHRMNIVRFEITLLDKFHTMARIHWKSLFTTPEKRTGEIDFDVIYLVQHIDQRMRIFAFITGDEREALKKHGLIP